MQSWRDVQKDFWLCDQDDAQICVSLCYKRWGRVPLVRASLCPSPACFEPSRPQYLAVQPPRHFPEVKAVLRILKQTPANRGKSHKQLNPIDSIGKGRTNCLTQEIQLSLVTQLFLKCFNTSYSRTGWRWRQNMRSKPKLSVDQLLELTANVGGGALACTSAHREVLLGLVLAPIGFAALTQVKRKQ